MKKYVIGMALLSQCTWAMYDGMIEGSCESTSLYRYVMGDDGNFQKVEDESNESSFRSNSSFNLRFGTNTKDTPDGTIWKFIRGLENYNEETGANALQTLLSCNGLSLPITSKFSWRTLKKAVDEQCLEDRKSKAVYKQIQKYYQSVIDIDNTSSSGESSSGFSRRGYNDISWRRYGNTSRSSEYAESLGSNYTSNYFNHRRNSIESILSEAKSAAENESYSAVSIDEEMDSRLKEISEKLSDIKIDMKEGKFGIEEALDRYQGAAESNIRSLIRELKKQVNLEKSYIIQQNQEKIRCLEEAYDRYTAMLQEKINEITERNVQLEKENELNKQVSRVFWANSSLKREIIVVRSGNILEIDDISKRYETLKSYYNIFMSFSELFSSNYAFSQHKSYVNKIKNLLDQFEHIMVWTVWWGDRFDSSGDVRDFARSRGFERAPWSESHLHPEIDFYWHETGSAIEVAFKEEKRKDHNEKIKNEILSIRFPIEAFDSLVEQFNGFVNWL